MNAGWAARPAGSKNARQSRPGASVANAPRAHGEAQHGGHMREGGLADVGDVGRRADVVLAVGHGEPALQQGGGVAGRLVEGLRHPETEQVGGVVVRVVGGR